MGVFDRQIATAEKLIQKFGKECVWREWRDSAPSDPNKPWIKSTDQSTDYSVTIVFLPSSERYLKDGDSKLVNVGDEIGYMAPHGFTPSLRGEIYEANGVDLLRTVNAVDLISPNGEKVLYTLQLSVPS